MRVINLWAGPGAGKSTTAAGLFYLMKSRGHRAELVTEYAKEIVYEKGSLADQFYITAQQNKRLERLRDSVDFAITDSPLPLALMFASEEYQADWFELAVKNVFKRYDNTNVRIIRTKKFETYGRVHDEQQARALDKKIYRLLNFFDEDPFSVEADEAAPEKIYQRLFGE